MNYNEEKTEPGLVTLHLLGQLPADEWVYRVEMCFEAPDLDGRWYQPVNDFRTLEEAVEYCKAVLSGVCPELDRKRMLKSMSIHAIDYSDNACGSFVYLHEYASMIPWKIGDPYPEIWVEPPKKNKEGR